MLFMLIHCNIYYWMLFSIWIKEKNRCPLKADQLRAVNLWGGSWEQTPALEHVVRSQEQRVNIKDKFYALVSSVWFHLRR